MDDEQPRHWHDCRACTFLGRMSEADLYFCRQHGLAMPTVIARFGPADDYLSGLAFADAEPHLHEARARSRARGLLRD
jgi:hypothetical protein